MIFTKPVLSLSNVSARDARAIANLPRKQTHILIGKLLYQDKTKHEGIESRTKTFLKEKAEMKTDHLPLRTRHLKQPDPSDILD